METVYLTHQGAVLRKTGKRLLVEFKGEKLAQIPAFSVKRVIIYGNIGVTTEALRFLLTQGIAVAYLTTRGQFRGCFYSPNSPGVYLRLAQYERYLDDPFRLTLAREIVRGKLCNQRTVVNHLLKRRPSLTGPLRSQLTRAIDDLDGAADLNTLRGLEGQGAAAYFRMLGAYLDECAGELGFQSRNRRPPRDPVNAMLSFGYTLLTSEITGLIHTRGLEPNLGFLHGIKYGRPSLSLDLVEEYRAPIIDRLVLALANQRVFTSHDFEPDPSGGGCRLRQDKLPLFLTHYDRKLNTGFIDADHNDYTNYRRRMGTQIDHLARVLQLQDPLYQPFRIL